MIFFYISISTYICFLVLKYRKGIILLNKSNNNLKKYKNNFVKHSKNLFLTPELLSIILIIIAVNTNEKITGACFVIFYTLLFLYFLRNEKDSFKLTKHNISLIIILSIVFIILNILFNVHYKSFHGDFLIFDTLWIYYITIILVSYFSYFIIFIFELINKVIEKIMMKKHKI